MSKSVRFALLVVCFLPLFSAGAITRTWVGSLSNSFSEPNNWSPAGVPVASDPLVFNSTGTLNNDLPTGTSFGPMTFNQMPVTLNGNQLTLTGDVTLSMMVGEGFVCNADLKIGASLTLGSASSNIYNGAIDVNGQTLTIQTYNTTVSHLNGTGTLIAQGAGLTLASDGTFSGTMTGDFFTVNGSLPNANIAHQGSTWPAVSGAGTVGNLEAAFISRDVRSVAASIRSEC